MEKKCVHDKIILFLKMLHCGDELDELYLSVKFI